jgi:uncharacterized membrane protein required for colicin V production
VNWIDIAVLVVWGVSALWGFRTGLLQMLILLVVVAAGLAFSSRIAGPVGDILSPFTDSENVQSIVALIFTLVVLLVVGTWVGSILRTALGFLIIFGLINSMAGMAVGILLGLILVSGILTGAQQFPFGDITEDIDESMLGSFFADQFDVVIRGIKLVPSGWH